MNLGTLYKFGLGVTQNYQKAMYWFRLSARQGNPMAEAFLGSMYTFGWGVPRSCRKAQGWYRKARTEVPDMKNFDTQLKALGCTP